MVWAAVAVAAVGVGALSMAAVRSGCCAAWLERWALLVCRLPVVAGRVHVAGGRVLAAGGRVLAAAVAAAGLPVAGGRVLAAVVAAGSADAAIAAVGRAAALDPALVAQPVSNHIRQTQ